MKFFIEANAIYFRNGKAPHSHCETFTIEVNDTNEDLMATVARGALQHMQDDEELSSALDLDSSLMLRIRVWDNADEPPVLTGDWVDFNKICRDREDFDQKYRQAHVTLDPDATHEYMTWYFYGHLSSMVDTEKIRKALS